MIWDVFWDVGFGAGFCCLCKPFRKSEVVFGGVISEIRNSVGFGSGFGDWDLGLWKELWKSGNWVGICWGGSLWKSFGG